MSKSLQELAESSGNLQNPEGIQFSRREIVNPCGLWEENGLKTSSKDQNS